MSTTKSNTAPRPKQSAWAKRYHAERQRHREMDEVEARLLAEDEPIEAWNPEEDFLKEDPEYQELGELYDSIPEGCEMTDEDEDCDRD